MGGKWSICARNLHDKCLVVCDYNCNLMEFIFKGIYCLVKYDVVELGKHGRQTMTRLIDADDLKNKFWHGDLVPNKDMYHISEIMCAIDNAPTVSKKELEKIFYETAEKPELKEVFAYECGKNERPRGKWIKSSNMSKRSYQRVCNQCNHISYFCGDGNYPNCPYCLSDMREADND